MIKKEHLEKITIDAEFINFLRWLQPQIKAELDTPFETWMHGKLSPEMNIVGNRMKDAGHKTYLVGGAVRDSLMNYNTENKRLRELLDYCDDTIAQWEKESTKLDKSDIS